jgi:membrane-associated HD superfamily phosphohydrolase
VGKTGNAGIFIENQRDRVDPHAGLDPAESARLIKQHVADGVELAHKHQLPRAVADVIQQHHGTTLVRFFYQRAVELSQSRAPFPVAGTRAGVHRDALPADVAMDAFRYDGPRPQFKESAIISLADGVEATTRSLRQVDAGQLNELVNRIVGERIQEGQLDEAPLTLEELTKIKNSFQFTLLNMLHGRVAYPEKRTDDASRPSGDQIPSGTGG